MSGNEIARALISMMAGSTNALQSEAGYIDARPLTAISAKTSCDARPDHTIGGEGMFSTRPVMPNDRTLLVLTASSVMSRRRHRVIRERELPADTPEQTIERHDPIEPPDLFGDAIGPQQVAHPSTRPDDAQRNAARGELIVQPMQHAGA